MKERDIEKISKKIKFEIYKKFNILDEEMKKDLFQEAFLACIEIDDLSDEKVHWVIVRSLSKFYWANISIVKRVPIRKTNRKSISKTESQKSIDYSVYDTDFNAENLIEFDVTEDLYQQSEDALKRVSRELFLIPEAKKVLSKREWDIIKDRVISTKPEQKTRNEISKTLSISSERVRQIEINGLNKIKGVLENTKNPLHILHPSY